MPEFHLKPLSSFDRRVMDTRSIYIKLSYVGTLYPNPNYIKIFTPLISNSFNLLNKSQYIDHSPPWSESCPQN